MPPTRHDFRLRLLDFRLALAAMVVDDGNGDAFRMLAHAGCRICPHQPAASGPGCGQLEHGPTGSRKKARQKKQAVFSQINVKQQPDPI